MGFRRVASFVTDPGIWAQKNNVVPRVNVENQLNIKFSGVNMLEHEDIDYSRCMEISCR